MGDQIGRTVGGTIRRTFRGSRCGEGGAEPGRPVPKRARRPRGRATAAAKAGLGEEYGGAGIADRSPPIPLSSAVRPLCPAGRRRRCCRDDDRREGREAAEDGGTVARANAASSGSRPARAPPRSSPGRPAANPPSARRHGPQRLTRVRHQPASRRDRHEDGAGLRAARRKRILDRSRASSRSTPEHHEEERRRWCAQQRRARGGIGAGGVRSKRALVAACVHTR